MFKYLKIVVKADTAACCCCSSKKTYRSVSDRHWKDRNSMSLAEILAVLLGFSIKHSWDSLHMREEKPFICDCISSVYVLWFVTDINVNVRALLQSSKLNDKIQYAVCQCFTNDHYKKLFFVLNLLADWPLLWLRFD